MENIINALTRAVAYERNNYYNESNFNFESECWFARGRADGLSSALHIAQELNKGTDIEMALRMVLDIEEE